MLINAVGSKKLEIKMRGFTIEIEPYEFSDRSVVHVHVNRRVNVTCDRSDGDQPGQCSTDHVVFVKAVD